MQKLNKYLTKDFANDKINFDKAFLLVRDSITDYKYNIIIITHLDYVIFLNTKNTIDYKTYPKFNIIKKDRLANICIASGFKIVADITDTFDNLFKIFLEHHDKEN